jgi:hypothetical protein
LVGVAADIRVLQNRFFQSKLSKSQQSASLNKI